MSYPTKYTRQFDFQSYQNANPSTPLPGDKVNADYNQAESSVGEIVDFLKLFTRSDGQIANAIIGRDQISADILALIDAPNGNTIVASVVTYDNVVSGLAATTVQAAIDELGTAAVTSVFGRTGAVVAAASDYSANEVDFTPAGAIAATDVQAAIEELDAEKQPLHSTLTSIAALGTAADKIAYTTGVDTWAETALTAFARSILDDASEAAFKATVNLEIGTDVLAQQTIGIADDNLLEVDAAAGAPASGEYARFTANGLEGRTEAEFKADFNLEAGTDFYSIAGADAAFQPLDADLTAVAALTTTAAGRSALAIADPNADRIVAWDDTAGAMAAIALTDLTDEAAPATGDYVLIYGAEGDLRKANWSTLPSGGIDNVVEDTTPQLGGALDGQGFDLNNMGVLFLTEQAAAEADVAGKGQLWVKNETPNELWFTDDAGTDAVLLKGGKHTFYVKAAALLPTITNGASRFVDEDATNDLMEDSLAFDPSTQEFATLDFVLPKRWDGGTITAKPHWRTTGGGATETVQFGFSAVAVGNDDAADAAPGTAQTSDDTWIADTDLHVAPATSAITIAGTPADGDLIRLKISRNPGSDTLGVDARLQGVEIAITLDKANDA